MLEKIKVFGDDAHPLFDWLQNQTNKEIQWNFDKFLIDFEGNVVKHVDQDTNPSALSDDFQEIYERLNNSSHRFKMHEL